MVNQENGVDLKSATQSDERKLFIETYGCQMNVADSEVVASIMKMDGYSMTENIEEADAIFVNTCSVRDNAEQKIYGRLQYFQSLKRKKKSLIVGVLGCMAERVRLWITSGLTTALFFWMREGACACFSSSIWSFTLKSLMILPSQQILLS